MPGLPKGFSFEKVHYRVDSDLFANILEFKESNPSSAPPITPIKKKLHPLLRHHQSPPPSPSHH